MYPTKTCRLKTIFRMLEPSVMNDTIAVPLKTGTADFFLLQIFHHCDKFKNYIRVSVNQWPFVCI